MISFEEWWNEKNPEQNGINSYFLEPDFLNIIKSFAQEAWEASKAENKEMAAPKEEDFKIVGKP